MRDHQQAVLLRRTSSSCGTRAIVPSSFMTSQMTPAGYSPAIRARSTAASVCPARTITPPVRDRSGNMWPGRARSDGCVAGSIAVSTVAARSAAEMPVVVRPFASIGTQNAVSNRERVLRDHQRDLELVEPLRRHRQTDQSASVPRHEVDCLRRDFLRRDRQIALVLPILVVDHDDHPAGADRRDGVLDPSERARLLSRTFRDFNLAFHLLILFAISCQLSAAFSLGSP